VVDAVVIPGGRYGPEAGLRMYAGAVPERRGAAVLRHHWSSSPGRLNDQTAAWVREEITAVLDRLGGHPLLIGKSLGSLAAGVAADRSLPAVWLTPLLTVPAAVAAMERATAPFLLVCGTADSWWDGVIARRLTAHILEVDGADHGMFVAGALTDTIAVLARVVTAVDQFLESLGWPP
jgi:pimeloyl-ACP methyl ester carboxylesterase